MTARVSEHLSTLLLDSLELGAPDPAARQRAETHLASCDRCRALRASAAEARTRFTAHQAPILEQRLQHPRPRWPLLLIPAAAALLVMVVVPRPTRTTVEDDGALIAKGQLSLAGFVARGDEVFPLSPGAVLKPGDRVRFVVDGVNASKPVYALVASVDGVGAVSVYFPFGADRSGVVEGGPRVELPGSVVLDAAPGPERVFAVFSETPFSAESVRAALAALGHAGPEELRSRVRLDGISRPQSTLWFEKDLR